MTEPKTSEELFDCLEELGIEQRTVTHPPVFTVEEAKAHRGHLRGTHVKNLFLRNKKGRMWLVVAPEDLTIDLKRLGRQIGAGHVSFGSADRLMQYLGVTPGAVTPFGLINDGQQAVEVVIDDGVLACDPIHLHPLRNDMTTAIAGKDLIAFLQACGHEPVVMTIERRTEG